MISNYIKGLLYGDGYYQKDEGLYFFSTTHKEINEKLREILNDLDIRHLAYQRDNSNYGNWELLEITEIKDKNFIDYLFIEGIISDDPYIRIMDDPDFIRGYLETKGTFFTFEQRNSVFWRCSFSGSYEDLCVLKEILNRWGISTHEIVQRKEREEYGIVSESHRLSIQSRGSIATLVEYIYGNGGVDISYYLSEKIEEFLHFHRSVPFNRKKSIFKNYKNAVLYMGREINLEIKGIRGGGGSRGYKPVYLWENDEPVHEFRGWEGAYEEVCNLYENKTGFKAPIVEESDGENVEFN